MGFSQSEDERKEKITGMRPLARAEPGFAGVTAARMVMLDRRLVADPSRVAEANLIRRSPKLQLACGGGSKTSEVDIVVERWQDRRACLWTRADAT